MRKLRRIHLIPVLVFPLCLVLSSLAQEKKEIEGVYTIKPGDTLWEISSKFLKDPFLLAKLWQWNPYITNPHRINPGEPVRLANGEDLKKEQPQKTVVEEEQKEIVTEPKVKELEPPPVEKRPEEVGEVKAAEEKAKAVEEKPKAVEEKPKATEEKPTVFPEVRSTGFFSDVDYRGIGIIVESKEGKTLMAGGDIVYVAFNISEPVSIGNRYTVFRASELITHPVTGKKIGRRYNIIGNVQIIDRYGRFYTGKVIEVFDAISKGDFIRPYFKEKMEVEQGKK
jgi:hypothetical protein